MSDKIKLLLSSAEKIVREKDINKLIYMLADLARELLEAHRMSLFLLDEQKGTLYTFVAHGVSRIEIPKNKGFVGYSATTGESLIVEDAYKDERFNPEVDKATGYRTKSVIVVPIFDRKGQVMGVFQGINKLSGNFTQEDLEILTLLGGFAGAYIENQALTEEIKKAHEETITRLSYAAEYKDPETYNHILRIGLFSELMAKKLGFDEKYCYNIRLAAPMHDIGKLGIPDAILLKKGKLEGEEWEVMKKHTIIGYNILKGSDSDLLKLAAVIALEHHEKWDGTGYPYGKKGEEINIAARITAIADVFDALTSKRPYKPAWSVEEATKYMKELKGRHFDPNLLDLFFENLDEVLSIKERYKDEKEPIGINFS
ncbi:MAG: HD domain-containing protein [Aquificota bacterium]|nr:MAG: HD domain-containing protein [Aquificota bacterium]